MVELKHFEACGVTAPHTFATERLHKFTLSTSATLSERSAKLCASTITACAVDVLRADERASRSVVAPKG